VRPNGTENRNGWLIQELSSLSHLTSLQILRLEKTSEALFLRRRLGVQASQGPGRPGRLANPRLIRFSFISPIFSHFLLIWRRALYSPRHRLVISKGPDRLTLPCRLKNIDQKMQHNQCYTQIVISKS
jgi:hypothetical protein